MKTIKYRGGYKYQLAKTYMVLTGICPKDEVDTPYLRLSPLGLLVIREGYSWDGASGPGWDTGTIMRGSLVHDALYQLMRGGHLAQTWRHEADAALKQICLEDGMSKARAWWVHRAVRWCGANAASPLSKKEVFSAP